MDANLVFKSDKGNPVTNSLLVAEKFEKNHSHILRDIENLSCSKEFRASNFGLSSYTSQQNKELPMYVMTKDGFTFLVMGYTGDKAAKFKEDFISAFNKMEAMLTSDDYILLRSRQILENKVSLLEARTEAQTKLINEIAPKAEYFDKTLMSKDSMTTTQIAKELGLSGQTLNKKLKELGVQYKVNGQWLLYAKYQDKGYTKPHTYTEIIDGVSKTYVSTVWTQKGRVFIHSLITAEETG